VITALLLAQIRVSLVAGVVVIAIMVGIVITTLTFASRRGTPDP
jgi:hypothetical protein